MKFNGVEVVPHFNKTHETEMRRLAMCREFHSDCEECDCGYIRNTGDDETPEYAACGFYKLGLGFKDKEDD